MQYKWPNTVSPITAKISVNPLQKEKSWKMEIRLLPSGKSQKEHT